MIETEFKFKAKLRNKDIERIWKILKIIGWIIIAILGL